MKSVSIVFSLACEFPANKAWPHALVFAPGRARIPSCLFSQNLQEPGISGCLWTAKPREPLRSRVPWPHSHPVWGQNTAKHQCPCPLQPQALVSRGGKCARGTHGMFHRVPPHVSPPRLLSPKCIWKYQLLCQTRDKSELMDSKPLREIQAFMHAHSKITWTFFFFPWKPGLKQGSWSGNLSGERRQQWAACQGRVSRVGSMGCWSHAYTWEKAAPKPRRGPWYTRVDGLNASGVGAETCLRWAGEVPAVSGLGRGKTRSEA